MVLGVPISNIDYPARTNPPLTVTDRFDQDAWLWLNAWFLPTQFLQVWGPFWINTLAVFAGQMIEEESDEGAVHTFNH